MSGRPRRNHAPVFESKVTLAAIKGEKTISELAQQFDAHPNQIAQWKAQLLERAGEALEGSGQTDAPQVDITALHAKIGALTLENDFLKVRSPKPTC